MKNLAGMIIAFVLGLAVGAFMAIGLTGRSLEAPRQTGSPAATPSANYLGSPVTSATAAKFADPAYRRRLSGTARAVPDFNRIIEVRAKGLIESVDGSATARTILFQVAAVEGFQALRPGGQSPSTLKPNPGGPPSAIPIAAGGKIRARVSPLVETSLEPGFYNAVFRFGGHGLSEPPIAVKLERLGK